MSGAVTRGPKKTKKQRKFDRNRKSICAVYKTEHRREKHKLRDLIRHMRVHLRRPLIECPKEVRECHRRLLAALPTSVAKELNKPIARWL